MDIFLFFAAIGLTLGLSCLLLGPEQPIDKYKEQWYHSSQF